MENTSRRFRGPTDLTLSEKLVDEASVKVATPGVCRREVQTIGLKVGEISTAVPRIVLEPQPGVFFLPRGDGTARGMQRQNIVVNRSCTGDGSTEAE